MFSPSSTDLRLNPELRSLYEIAHLPQPQTHLQDYFHGVMALLSEYFPIEYSALILHDAKKDSFSVEALYGIGGEIHPHGFGGRKGMIARVLETRQPAAIQNLNQEPLYEEMVKGTKRIEKIQPPLLCIPLISEDEPMGVLNINPLYGSKNEFSEDFQFLSILSLILSPVIKNFQIKKGEPPVRPGKSKLKTSLLEEILEERVAEVLDKIDPYVESKSRTGLLDDIIALVEKILIKSTLRKADHVQTAAAQLLGINRNTLRKKIKDLKIKTR
jgi:Fis family transcriptional regulator